MVYRFGEYALDTELFELRRGDGVVELTPKTFERSRDAAIGSSRPSRSAPKI